MKRQGFLRLYELVHEYDPELAARLPPPGDSFDPCDLCHRIYSDPGLVRGVDEVFRSYARDRTAAAVDSLASVLGSQPTVEFLTEILRASSG